MSRVECYYLLLTTDSYLLLTTDCYLLPTSLRVHWAAARVGSPDDGQNGQGGGKAPGRAVGQRRRCPARQKALFWRAAEHRERVQGAPGAASSVPSK